MKKVNHYKKRILRLDSNVSIDDIIETTEMFELYAKLDYESPACPDCQWQMTKYDFQKSSKTPIGQTGTKPIYLYLKKRRFKCKFCNKMLVAVTPLVKKTSQLSAIIVDEIYKLADQNYSINDISKSLPVSYTTVIRILKGNA